MHALVLAVDKTPMVLRRVLFDWLTGLFFFVLLLMLAATAERAGKK